jgi:hypothetical protein
MVQIEQGRAPGSPSTRRLKESIVERACTLACIAALVVMLVVIGVDILTRSLFNFSFEISDELGGYMLVVITFVSLPVCQMSRQLSSRGVGPVSPLAVRPRSFSHHL